MNSLVHHSNAKELSHEQKLKYANIGVHLELVCQSWFAQDTKNNTTMASTMQATKNTGSSEHSLRQQNTH
jgi:hypothetical protein